MSPHNFYIYSNCDFSTKSAGATRMLYYAQILANERNKVYLISCSSGSIEKSMFSVAQPNIFIHTEKELTRKPLKTLSFLNKLHKFAKNNPGEDTFILYPYPFIFLELFSVFYFIFIRRNKVFYELNEVRKYASEYHQSISFKRIWYSLKKLKNTTAYAFLDALLPFFKGLICISSNIEIYGKRYNKNTFRLPILTDPNIEIKTSKHQYATKDSFNIGFSGSILLSKENLISFVQVFNKLIESQYNLTFNLCGSIDSKDKNFLIEQLDTYDKIQYHGNLDKNELSSFLNQQDLLILPRGFSLQNKYGFSTKLSDYLNHKKVILVTDISDNKMYINDGVNGFIVPPNDEELMFDKLKNIVENFDNIKTTIISNAEQTSKENFDYRLFKTTFQAFLIAPKKSIKI